MSIRSNEDEYLGEVVDLMMETTGGAIAFVLFQYRNENKHFIIPYTALAFSDDCEFLKINSSRSVFENTPGVVGYKDGAFD